MPPVYELAQVGEPLDPQDRFAAYVAHELRTLIACQLASAEAALADPHADAVVWRVMAERVVAGCEEQERVIEALLNLTRGRHRVRRHAAVDIAAITRRALQALVPDDLGDLVALEPAVACGDPTLLERLVANLVTNAIRHNIPHGRIELTTGTYAGCAVLSVANTGPLIPAGQLARLFQPFQRLGSRLHADDEGVGLGLTIVESIADAHGATIAAHARVGGGLKVELRFPPCANRPGCAAPGS